MTTGTFTIVENPDTIVNSGTSVISGTFTIVEQPDTIVCAAPIIINTVPTIAGYTNWIRMIMGVPFDVLPDSSPYIVLSFDMASETVNLYLDIASPLLYTQAIYNLAADIMVNITQDNPSLPPPDNTYWSTLRQSLGVNNFIPGFINAANDEDTSAALLVPLGLQNLTLADLQNLKTPWGRAYLSIAQSVGSMWGLTL